MSDYVTKSKQLDRPLTSRLSHIDIELTERCNNRCIHCYINQPADDQNLKAREMDSAFIKDLLRQAADLGCLSVRFTGGEPLLREDFIELYLYARRLGLRVNIFTNARLITPELAGLFSRIPPGKPVEVSVYGMHADSYNSVASVHGAYEQFRQGVALLLEHNVPFAVKGCLLPQNRNELAGFEDFAGTLPYMEQKPGYVMNFDLRARRDDKVKNRNIMQLRISPEETLALLTREPEKYMMAMCDFTAKFIGPSGEELFNCGAGLGVCVDAYGYAQMCVLLRHPDTVYPLDVELHRERNPHLEMDPLNYVLSGFFPKIRLLRARNPDYLRRCAICFLKGLCEQCPGKSWMEHGTLDTPVEYLCELAHAQADYLGLLAKGKKSWEHTPTEWQARLKNFVNKQNSK